MLVWQNVYLSKCIIADQAVQSIRKVVIQYIRVRIKIKNFKIENLKKLMLKKLKSKSFKNILSKVYAWKWPTQCITEWLSKKQSENEILKL